MCPTKSAWHLDWNNAKTARPVPRTYNQINASNGTASQLSLDFDYFGSVFLIHTVNNVNYLLRVQFSTLPLEEKLEIKRLGPHRPDDLILQQPGEKATRTFKTEWYDRKTWLTASTSKRALFCFPFLLFGIGTNADSVRTTDGFKTWSIWQKEQ